MSKLILPAALLAVLLCPAQALARDYGQRGTVFPVIERDLLEQIHSRLAQMERSGETARLNEDLKRRTIARVKRQSVILPSDEMVMWQAIAARSCSSTREQTSALNTSGSIGTTRSGK